MLQEITSRKVNGFQNPMKQNKTKMQHKSIQGISREEDIQQDYVGRQSSNL